MSPRLPRALVFGGRVTASALWFDRRALGEAEARRRAMAWLGDARELLAFADGYLLKLEPPRPLDAERCPGAPVVEHRGRWCTAPLRPDEHERLGAPPGSLVLVRDGGVVVRPLAEAAPVDVATWLDVSDWALLPVESLGTAPPATAPTPGAPPEDGDLPRLLGDRLPPPAPARAAIMAALAEREAGSSGGDRPGLLTALGAWLSGRLSGEPSRALPPGDGPPGPGGGAPPPEPAPPGRLRSWLNKLAARSRLGEMIGRRQAAYFEHTRELFEAGEWDEALRHAIPFGSSLESPKPRSFSLLSPRASLDLSATPTPGASTSMHLGDELFAHFKALYTRAARELEAQGRIEEAAYVLFELLGEVEEGVAMLERHEHYELAARMAEGRGLPPGRVIRLWFLAREPARAILVARRTGAFADAIERLQRNEPDLAARLRLSWADRLAGAGDFAAAVDAVMPLPEARRLARAWIDRAIDLGGPTACRMLPKKLGLWPDDPTVRIEVTEQVQAMLARDDPDAPALRRALGEAWPADGRAAQPEWGTLASAMARSLLADAGRAGRGGPPEALMRALDDPVLRHDLGGVPLPRVDPPPPRSVLFEAHERGLTAVFDAMALPSGRVLLALGDAGMRLVDAQGRTLRSYEHPADHFVVSDHAASVIALSRRGRTWSLRRVDMATGRAEVWCDARFDLYAPSFDGAGWFVTADDALVLVDAQEPGFTALWSVGGLPARPIALARSSTHLSFVLPHAAHPLIEVWTYEQTEAGPVLRQRRPVDLPWGTDATVAVSVEPGGRVVAQTISAAFAEEPRGLRVETRLHPSDRLHARADHVLLQRRHGRGVALHRLAYDSLVPTDPVLDLHGSEHVYVRPQPDGTQWVVDERGRVVGLDARGRITRALLV